MNDGWIKLHRSLLDNDLFFQRGETFKVWCWILLMVDRKTGTFTTGRKQASMFLHISPSAFYRAIKRLQTEQRVNIKVNRAYTTISVLNWSKYQQSETDRTTQKSQTEQQPNTITRSKKQEYISKDVVLELLTYWNTLYKTKYSGVTPLVENVSYWLGIYSLEQVKEAIQNIALDNYWKNKMTPTMLFRQRNQNREQVDYIGSLLNIVRKEDPFTPGYTVHYSKAYEKSN